MLVRLKELYQFLPSASTRSAEGVCSSSCIISPDTLGSEVLLVSTALHPARLVLKLGPSAILPQSSDLMLGTAGDRLVRMWRWLCGSCLHSSCRGRRVGPEAKRKLATSLIGVDLVSSILESDSGPLRSLYLVIWPRAKLLVA